MMFTLSDFAFDKRYEIVIIENKFSDICVCTQLNRKTIISL